MEGEEKKDNEQEEVHHEYLKEIIDKYDFIEAIYITDFDGAVIAQELQKPIENEDESYKKIHGILLAYNFNLLSICGLNNCFTDLDIKMLPNY